MSAYEAQEVSGSDPQSERFDWIGNIPILAVHAACLGVFITGLGWWDVALIVALYYVRMFFITGGYHRYFSHKSYKATRPAQFGLALGGSTAAQNGPLWWPGWHRWHHRWSDTPHDVHSNTKYRKPGSTKVTFKGFWWSHMGWILSRKYRHIPNKLVQQWAKYWELRLIQRFYYVPPALLAVALWYVHGGRGLVDFFISTTLLYHGTFAINSFAHLIGKRERENRPKDSSGNSWWLTFITLGEGWHNDHHHYARSTKQGIGWWKLDPTYYGLWLMQGVGYWWPHYQDGKLSFTFVHLLVWDVSRHPDHEEQAA